MEIKSLIVFIGICIFLILEFLFPKEKIYFKNKISRISKNIFFWLVNIGITPIIILPISIFATQFELHSLFKFNNSIMNFLFHLMIIDLFLYWWHRFNHQIPFLWKFHHVHHLDETLDISSGVRFHFVDVILSALILKIMLIIFKISLLNFLLMKVIILLSTIFNH